MPIWLLIKPFLSLKNIGYAALAILIAFGSYKLYAYHSDKVEAKYLFDVAEGKAIVQKQWDAQKAIDKAAYDKSVKIAKAKEQEWTTQIQDAQNEADKQKQIAQVAATVSRSNVIGLLSTTSITESKLPTATKETSDEYTKVLGNSFRDCVTQYTEMGERYSQYKIGYEQLDAAWPNP